MCISNVEKSKQTLHRLYYCLHVDLRVQLTQLQAQESVYYYGSTWSFHINWLNLLFFKKTINIIDTTVEMVSVNVYMTSHLHIFRYLTKYQRKLHLLLWAIIWSIRCWGRKGGRVHSVCFQTMCTYFQKEKGCCTFWAHPWICIVVAYN